MFAAFILLHLLIASRTLSTQENWGEIFRLRNRTNTRSWERFLPTVAKAVFFVLFYISCRWGCSIFFRRTLKFNFVCTCTISTLHSVFSKNSFLFDSILVTDLLYKIIEVFWLCLPKCLLAGAGGSRQSQLNYYSGDLNQLKWSACLYRGLKVSVCRHGVSVSNWNLQPVSALF